MRSRIQKSLNSSEPDTEYFEEEKYVTVDEEEEAAIQEQSKPTSAKKKKKSKAAAKHGGSSSSNPVSLVSPCPLPLTLAAHSRFRERMDRLLSLSWNSCFPPSGCRSVHQSFNATTSLASPPVDS